MGYEGDLQNRLNSSAHRLLLLDFLLSELMSARIDKLKSQPSQELESVESSTTAQLTESLKTLNLSNPPAGVSPAQFFKQLLSVIERVNPAQREVLIGKPFFTGSLSNDQWKILQQASMDLESEYAMRRTMLITRLQATVQSFTWSDRAKNMSKSALEAAEMNDFKTSAFTNVSVADVIAARTDLTTINKVSSVPPATRGLAKTENYGQLTKVKIGRVPDRGGRPSEQAPPPPEMPSWQQRTGPQHGQQGGSGQGGLHFFGGGNQSGGSRGGGSHKVGETEKDIMLGRAMDIKVKVVIIMEVIEKIITIKGVAIKVVMQHIEIRMIIGAKREDNIMEIKIVIVGYKGRDGKENINANDISPN